ncbi:Bgt-748 [Blumeria graminis f. sp. tritici]|uniref:Bgt-748 n=2 Tax=Blumeria graminis f. sp. tritici TaxID=62690 RepID=A0A381LFR1_BLUGR|nr:hypothetical protein BGT96224_748 [Blumeria graminis f. sp. tritici 96224]VDB95301.1 Bgt-748 [Blumeria graminis f. sp. tritici]
MASSVSTYALPESHKQLMEKSLLESDPEVAELMIGDKTSTRIYYTYCFRKCHFSRCFRCLGLTNVQQIFRRLSRC